jgi:uncharacterized membrane protein YjgN (DUF898 family)
LDPATGRSSAPLPPDSPAAAAEPVRPEFVGSGGEYFRIWIVNLLLSVVTLGLYSPWAKVRREQYFHRNTRLAGAPFDYDASPWAILRGRAIAVALLVALNLSGWLDPVAYAALAAGFVVLTPWMIAAALRFRLQHTLHRGLRFRFLGRVGEAARSFLLFPLLGAVTLGALVPVALQRQQRFVYGRAAYGGTPFALELPSAVVYRACLVAAGLALACAAAVGSAAFLVLPLAGDVPGAWAGAGALLIPLAAIAASVVGSAALWVGLQNAVWNRLRLGAHRFRCRLHVRTFLALQLGNLVAMAATLGLFRPWAVVRVARYRAEHLELLPGGPLEAFVADARAADGALGDQVAELFGFDIGF